MWLSPNLSSFSRTRSAGGRRRRDRNDGGGGGGNSGADDDDSLRWGEPRRPGRRGSDTGFAYSDYERGDGAGGGRGDGGGYSYGRMTSHGSPTSEGSVSSTKFGSGSRGGSARAVGLLRRNPPTLTVILSRLEACLPSYCDALSTPTEHNAGSAAKVLDESLYPSAPPESGTGADPKDRAQPTQHATTSRPVRSVDSSPSNSPAEEKRTAKVRLSSASPKSPTSPLSSLNLWARKKIPSNLSSISASPYLLGGADDSRRVDGGDPALEAEWNRMVDPLMLLAGAERLYGALEHLDPADRSPPTASKPAATASPSIIDKVTAARKVVRNKRGDTRLDDFSPLPEPKAMAQSSELSSPSRPSLSPGAEKIRLMYGKVKNDLIIVKELLCDPILGTSALPQAPLLTAAIASAQQGGEAKQQEPVLLIPPAQALRALPDGQEEGQQLQMQPQTKSEPLRSAESLAHSISVLTDFCDARRDMISIHSDLVLLGEEVGVASDKGTRSTIFGLAERCDAILNSIPDAKVDGDKDKSDARDDDFDAVRPMVEAMRHELRATGSALRAMGYLDACSFFETVLQVRRLKVALGSTSPFHSDPPCALEMWLRHILSGMLSLMTIYFDRIDAYGSSMYGFQKHIMVEDKVQDAGKKTATATAGGPSSPQGSPTSHCLTSHLSRKTEWCGPVVDLDTEVIEFLHYHEERNGAALAVCLVCNSRDCLAPTFDRGFTAVGSNAVSSPASASHLASDKSIGGEDKWPAVYLRTTIKSGDPDYELRLSGAPGNTAAAALRRGPRRPGSKGMSMSGLSQLLSSGGEMASQGLSGIKRPSYAGNTSSRGSLISMASEQSLGLDSESGSLAPSPVVKAAEYGYGLLKATIESPSWPQTEMAVLASMLRGDNDRAQSVSFRKQANIHPASSSPLSPFGSPRRPTLLNPFSPLIEENVEDASFLAASPVRSVIAASPSSPSSPESPPNIAMLHHAASSYHFLQVSDALWLSVMIQGEGDDRRLRRKSRGLSDDEIRSWISQFAAKLRLSGLYCPKSVVNARKESTRLALPVPSSESSREIRWKDAETNEYLVSYKESLGLKPSSPLTAPLKSPYLRKDNKLFGSSKRLAPKQKQQDDASAAAFFLGADLGRMF